MGKFVLGVVTLALSAGTASAQGYGYGYGYDNGAYLPPAGDSARDNRTVSAVASEGPAFRPRLDS